MIFINNIPFPDTSETLNSLIESNPRENIYLYQSPTENRPKYLLVGVKHMLNLLYECQEETNDEIIAFGEFILQTATVIKEHCLVPEHERAIVRSICISDNANPIEFVLGNAVERDNKGCQLWEDQTNHIWAIFVDDVELHRFHHEGNARRVFEYIKRDIRQSSDKWLCVIDNTPSRF